MVRSVLFGLTSDFPLNLLPLDFHSWGILLPIAIMEDKQQNNLLEIENPTSSLGLNFVRLLV